MRKREQESRQAGADSGPKGCWVLHSMAVLLARRAPPSSHRHRNGGAHPGLVELGRGKRLCASKRRSQESVFAAPSRCPRGAGELGPGFRLACSRHTGRGRLLARGSPQAAAGRRSSVAPVEAGGVLEPDWQQPSVSLGPWSSRSPPPGVTKGAAGASAQSQAPGGVGEREAHTIRAREPPGSGGGGGSDRQGAGRGRQFLLLAAGRRRGGWPGGAGGAPISRGGAA